jgi:hypothetical protein
MDVVIGNGKVQQTRLWSPKERKWITTDFPAPLVTGDGQDASGRFGVVRPDGRVSLLLRNESISGAWHFDGARWVEDRSLLTGLNGKSERVVRLRDLDGDGRCELIVSSDKGQAIFTWNLDQKQWRKLPFTLPPGASIGTADGKDAGLRFVDLDGDGFDDIVFSNETGYGIYLFADMKTGWSRKVMAGKPGDKGALPLNTRNGQNMGFFAHSSHLWWQNENTDLLPNLVARRSFNELLEHIDPPAKSAEASLRCIRPRPGFQVELVAAEPLVQSPIAFAWGADGKLWVVEMGDYPLGIDGKGKPGGKIKYLEDTKGTGKYDKATVFLDGLPFPTGVMPWRKGIIVTCAPDIFYAEDTKGTGKADLRIPLYTGFNEGNQQHRVNSLIWGLDNWIYCANGDSGGQITSLKR